LQDKTEDNNAKTLIARGSPGTLHKMLESGIIGSLFLKMSVVRFLELIAKIGITKIGITNLGTQSGWITKITKIGIAKIVIHTTTSGECKLTAHDRLLAHHHCDRLAMPPANQLTTFLDRRPCNPTHFLPQQIT
jgi:hypothetical protein